MANKWLSDEEVVGVLRENDPFVSSETLQRIGMVCAQAKEATRLREGIEQFLDDLDELHSGPYELMFLRIRELLEGAPQ